MVSGFFCGPSSGRGQQGQAQVTGLKRTRLPTQGAGGQGSLVQAGAQAAALLSWRLPVGQRLHLQMQASKRDGRHQHSASAAELSLMISGWTCRYRLQKETAGTSTSLQLQNKGFAADACEPVRAMSTGPSDLITSLTRSCGQLL